MSLLKLQDAFMAQVLDEDAEAIEGWGERHAAGMAIYRNNYRSSLVDALRSTYERTARWVGDDAFRRAAAHHLITHPPASWTIDDAGRGFDQTCAELFANDPEVAELAWLEWTMLEVFTQPDVAPLTGDGFAKATGAFAEEDWANMRLALVPGARARVVEHDLKAIWSATANEEFARPAVDAVSPQGVIVWREGERPTFLMVESEEADAFELALSGAAYGEVCLALAKDDPLQVNDAAMRAGAMLGRWLNEGLIASINSGEAS